jgi:cell division protein ZapA (FtsZ GTPase activity inhibitor)
MMKNNRENMSIERALKEIKARAPQASHESLAIAIAISLMTEELSKIGRDMKLIRRRIRMIEETFCNRLEDEYGNTIISSLDEIGTSLHQIYTLM